MKPLLVVLLALTLWLPILTRAQDAEALRPVGVRSRNHAGVACRRKIWIS